MIFLNSIFRNFAISCSLVLLMLIFRSWYTHSFFYGFLLWNLALAFIPFAISHYMVCSTHKNANNQSLKWKIKWWICFTIWLLFFPNAPYIITDLIHLTKRNDIPKWYDAAMLFTTASTGLWIGCISLQMEQLWRKMLPSIHVSFFVVTVFLLCGFGIYLGRITRLNSWEVITNPFYVLEAISTRILMPWKHLRTWWITVLFAAVLFVAYQQVKQLIQFRENSPA
jgi:uncharacterized membrane protein